MTAKEVLQAVNEIDGQDIGKGTRVVLEALVKDGEEMSKRMSSLEGKVDGIAENMTEIKNSIDKVINKPSAWKFLCELIKESKFWIWLTVITVLAFGVSITDLKGLLP
jgi:hypothetical protein